MDEAVHLPVGVYCWHTQRFWAYHHNPPVARLWCSVPLLFLGVTPPTGEYAYAPTRRSAEVAMSQDFESQHRHRYLAVFFAARCMGIALAVIGGCIAFSWARELYGDAAGLLALSLWTFSPFVLAHAGLVTPDMAVTVLGFAATYTFWRYLRQPTLDRAIGSGLLLGLAEAAKFIAVLLPPIWLALALVRFLSRGADIATRPSLRGALMHAGVITCTSLATLNTVYFWEGTGARLGDFDFRSRLLTRVVGTPPSQDVPLPRGNRFRGTWAHRLRVPFPEHYLLGFDDQLWDLDDAGFHKYLRGELRGPQQPGWLHYYVYGLLLKAPLGTLMLFGLAMAVLPRRRYRGECWTELTILLPIVAVIAALSMKTGLNSHIRYVLPVVPFAHLFGARAVTWCSDGRWWRTAIVLAAVLGNVCSVLRVHPHELTYFNELAGGPRGGIRELADSNLDWGQGLIALRDWLSEHARGESLHIAYFGMMDPTTAGIDSVPLDIDDPKRGLHAVSASLLAGLPLFTRDLSGRQAYYAEGALTRYQALTPVATPGYSIYVYRVGDEDLTRLREASP